MILQANYSTEVMRLERYRFHFRQVVSFRWVFLQVAFSAGGFCSRWVFLQVDFVTGGFFSGRNLFQVGLLTRLVSHSLVN